ncbi:hypothetical protein ACGFZQ_22910 [Streptomyces sp. NPDC048254]|uniref:hypothetical protein n=1 Tax=Streptomyces sp. NPDC048254 TaxID=3365525 RepID=UPI003717619B
MDGRRDGPPQIHSLDRRARECPGRPDHARRRGDRPGAGHLAEGALTGYSVGPEECRTTHFTTSPDPGALPGGLQDRRIRLRVDIPEADVFAWRPWLARNMPVETHWTLGGDRPYNGDPGAWYVTERAVPAAEWGEAVDLAARARLWPPMPS